MSEPEPKFPSDLDRAKDPELGALLQPLDISKRRSLFQPAEPYYQGGYRILAECPEFRLIQGHGPGGPKRMEWSYNLRHLYLKSILGVNSSSALAEGNWLERVRLASGLSALHSFYEGNRTGLENIHDPLNEHRDDWLTGTPNGGLGCTRILGSTLGAALDKMLQSSDPEQAIKDLSASLEGALKAVARLHGKLIDGRSTGRPKPHDAIDVAAQIYGTEETRPTKYKIRFLLESAYNFKILGKNKKGFWTDLFAQSGLGNLP